MLTQTQEDLLSSQKEAAGKKVPLDRVLISSTNCGRACVLQRIERLIEAAESETREVQDQLTQTRAQLESKVVAVSGSRHVHT